MKFENFNREIRNKRVLVAPLDWGLGHATRCIPIIYTLLALEIEVVIAASGKIENLLKKEFPKLDFIHLKEYNVHYSGSKALLPLQMILQFPKILSRIYGEHKWLKKIINQYHIDAVISDNRFGLYHTTTPCIYLTHQLKIITGKKFTERIAQQLHYFFINKYSQCWIPDTESINNIAGKLSHPKKLPNVQMQYLGPLSRFKKYDVEKKYDLVAVLSGPEPQRTIFENILLKDLISFSGKALLVRGLPGTTESCVCKNNNVEIQNHLNAEELNKAILQSAIVVCRSGYTTIMDLIVLQQKAILVPTPGQTEQEYLAHYLQQQNAFLSIDQDKFSLTEALQQCNGFVFKSIAANMDHYESVVKEFVAQIHQ
jgi:uncharacterized protein (TIGR00661 family)